MAQARPPRVMVLGGGPNRIGQGIEFDYCCVCASFALREMGFQSIMVNCNPETVSTDYDTSDRLYFEPLALEDVLGIAERERPLGAIVQFGGQTPLGLAIPLRDAGVKVLGTSPDAIDRAEDRKRFAALIRKLSLRQPESGTARSAAEAQRAARRLGYPVLVRPSYVLGGRAMEIIHGPDRLEEFVGRALGVSPDHPVLVDKFLEDAVEVDVDAASDGERTVIAGVMEHIEEAGIHSGDSCCVLPPFTLAETTVQAIEDQTRAIARELRVRGLLNIQFAVRGDAVYVLEVNPRASRTVPFVAKATGVAWAKVATRAIMGRSLQAQGVAAEVRPKHWAVKAPVFPWSRFPGVDPVLGPEMKSTGEVMGIDDNLGLAFAKAQIAAGNGLARRGRVFLSVNNHDKRAAVALAKRLAALGFALSATRGTAAVLRRSGLEVEELPKVQEGGRPNILDHMVNRRMDFLINTPSGRHARAAEVSIRAMAVRLGVPLVTTLSGAGAFVLGLEEMARGPMGVRSLQAYHRRLAEAP